MFLQRFQELRKQRAGLAVTCFRLLLSISVVLSLYYIVITAYVMGNINSIPKLQLSADVSSENAPTNYLFNCQNIPNINILKIIGHGVSKIGYLGEYNENRIVVRTPRGTEKKTCTGETNISRSAFLNNVKCYGGATRDPIREIYYLHHLRHPNIARLKGYCLSGPLYNKSALLHVGLSIVTEYGMPLLSHVLDDIGWCERLRHLQEIASLLVFFKNSQYGSLLFRDYKLRHFVVINSTVKVIDMDSIVTSEIKCDAQRNCDFGVKCDDITERCLNANEKFNIKFLYQGFLRHMLNERFFEAATYPYVFNVTSELLKLNAEELVERLEILREGCEDFTVGKVFG